MKTLIVNSYRVNTEAKILPFIEMVNKFSNFQVIADIELYSHLGFADYDALVLSGSADLISRGAYSKSYIEFLHYNTIPCLGICYGHQMLAKAFGVNINSGLTRIERNEVVRIIKSDRIFKDLPPEISVLESHIEYVDANGLAAAGFELLATSPSCEVEVIKHIEKCFYGVQFHPERSGPVGETIFKNFFAIVENKKSSLGFTREL
ncbi:MAG: gamma-glutamyl-gamma-aminobutyrate hydrolase family protein [Candidatus Latescibacteria bacterium]|nr:gamma-glutamyl-gamma-aminobutyrate hydrolase family protein [Candidatus Latescibacterota bacterium]